MTLVVSSMFFAVCGLSAGFTAYMRRYALDKNLIDVPNVRSSHTAPTPRGGGVAIVIALFIAEFALVLTGAIDGVIATALLGGGGAMALIGFIDDRRSLPARWRILVHFGAAILAVWLIGGLPAPSLAASHLSGVWAGRVIAVIGVVWVSNLFNFMDGIDGIAASEAIFVAGAGAWLSASHGVSNGLPLALLGVAAASLGFLYWNWPPAKIFMGDVGSGFLGFMLAAIGLACSQSGELPVEVWPILTGVFLVDSTVTLVTRMLRRQRWFEPHRTHAYQILSRRWRGHFPVTAAVGAINVGWLLPWAWAAASAPRRAAWCMAAALLPIAMVALATGAGRRDS